LLFEEIDDRQKVTVETMREILVGYSCRRQNEETLLFLEQLRRATNQNMQVRGMTLRRNSEAA
jgi:hypothetical protein